MGNHQEIFLVKFWGCLIYTGSILQHCRAVNLQIVLIAFGIFAINQSSTRTRWKLIAIVIGRNLAPKLPSAKQLAWESFPDYS